MVSSLPNLVYNLHEGIHEIKCKFRQNAELNTKNVTFFEYINFKDDLIEYKCLCCNKYYQQKFDGILKDRFINK